MTRSWLPDWEEVNRERESQFNQRVALEIVKLTDVPTPQSEVECPLLYPFCQDIGLPVLLECHKLKDMDHLSEELKKHKTKTPVYEAWRKLREDVAVDSPVGVVFDWPYMGRFWVFHDLGQFPEAGDGSFYRVKGKLFILQSLADLLAGLGSCEGW
jgi:hypothetical protein